MNKGQLTRRTFLGIAASIGVATTFVGCPIPPQGNGIIVYKRSGRGLHVSNAAKKHNANKLYATLAAAQNNPAHPGDHSKAVQITINHATYDRLFPSGKLIADLRRDL